MWFKNLRIYRFSRPCELNEESLETALAEFAFTPCGSQDRQQLGWVAPLGRHGHTLLHAASGNLLLCMRREERVLPSAVVKEALDSKVAEIEEAQGRPVPRKEQQTLKEEIEMQLLPRAFTRSQKTFAYVSPQENLLIVDASSAGKADELVSLLRKTVGSLPVVPLASNTNPAACMTDWVKNGPMPTGFSLLEEAELRDTQEDGGVIRCKQQDLTSDEIFAHLEAGKIVTKLAVDWRERLTCLLEQELVIKRLKFNDLLREESGNSDDVDAAAKFDADFLLMCGELANFIPELLEALGGEQSDDTE
ncbi:recombination-associated protein RdgC [Corallincola spongiicola]|uniref:Recombination-associated protein RdgC n=1 Tax=Corallincola spongiicola TaxID=2520508 RepID=A0ABY1WS69_9GAMM|nr:recombination-associated protein RdgC [Corallincola spongiicola]TAA47582.1 recombination-associated protein RdgC [Corallincola spongiicola]